MVNQVIHNVKLINGLHLLTLSGFAIAQPLYDLLSRYPTFFVASGASAKDLGALVLLLSFVLPVLFVFSTWLAGLLSQTAYRFLHNLFVGGLIFLAVLPVIKWQSQVSDTGLISIAAFICIVGLCGYVKSRRIREIVTLCSPAIIIFPLIFLFHSPVNKLVFAPESLDQQRVFVKNPMPIIMVVFDELSSTFLLNENGTIDSIRYPNFAMLAESAYWFANATTVDDVTAGAVPAILTGSYYGEDGGTTKLPALVDYPGNLFTLYDGAIPLNVHEYITRLSPRKPHFGDESWFVKNLVMLRDMAVVYFHVVSPEMISKKLPDISRNWRNFVVGETGTAKSDARINQKTVKNVPKTFIKMGARLDPFKKFLDSTQQAKLPSLNFMHMVFPHAPYEYFPSGRRYGRFVLTGLEEEQWSANEWSVKVGFQRYLLQLGYTDRLLGDLIDELKSNGTYDRSLIIVTSDHGVSFSPGHSRRGVREATMGGVMPVPLFIKLPGQVEGATDRRRVESIDILPTIADITGVEIPWKVDGYSLFGTDVPERSRASIRTSFHYIRQKSFDYSDLDLARSRSLQRMVDWFGSGSSRPDGLWRIGPHQEIIGKSIDTDLVVTPSRLRIQTEQELLFQESDEFRGALPAYVSGHIMADGQTMIPDSVAVVVANKVRATAEVSETGSFAVLIPDSAFQSGSEAVRLFMPEMQEDGYIHLLRPSQSVNVYRLDDGQLLSSGSNVGVPIRPGAIRGKIEEIRIRKNYGVALIEGWALNAKGGIPVDEVVVLQNGESIHTGQPAIDRPDVCAKFDDKRLLHCGFNITLPQSVFEKGIRVQIYALSGGVASELHISKGIEKKLGL